MLENKNKVSEIESQKFFKFQPKILDAENVIYATVSIQ